MQAEEIVRRAREAGIHVEPVSDLNGDYSLIPCAGTPVQFATFLPTDEERLAIKALRAGVQVQWSYDEACWCGYTSDLQRPRVRLPNEATSMLAKYAAAGRVLEEGEKRG